MKYASQALWWGIKESFFQIGRLIILNVSWVVFSLPLITLPAATLGMAYAIRVMVVDENNYSWKVFWQGFKRYWISSWRWFLPVIILPAIFIYNILFFAVESYALSVSIQAANIVLLAIWFFLQTFTLPFLVEEEKPIMRTALVNGIYLLYRKPGLYFLVTIFQIMFFLLSLILMGPILIVSVSMGLFIAMYCLQVFLGRRGMVPEEESSKVYKKPGSL
mgnify:CR=1 FL=1